VSWSVRHQGSPQRTENLNVGDVVEGLRDGLWDGTDEVMGPQDSDWVAIENHPQFAEVTEEIETPKPLHTEDETRLDMNALIDVCLVLLIFFILTLSYQTLEKVLEMPRNKADDPGAVKVVSQDRVEHYMIVVKARQEDGAAVIWVEAEKVPESQLKAVLKRLARAEKKTEILLDAADVDYGTVIKIIDAAGGANIDQVHFLKRPGTV
jgi:biopolymer transport protein ExbD